MMEEAEELEYLRWFAMNADFGPAHGGYMINLQALFSEETGKAVPKNWVYE
jgi:hypothetical protein